MKDRMYYSIAEYANLLMAILIHQSFLLLGEYAIGVTPSVLYAVILAVTLVFSHFTRTKISYFLLYAGLHVVYFAALFFLPKDDIKIYFIIYIGVLFYLDFVHWIRKREGGIGKIPIWFVALNAGAYLYSSIRKNDQGMLLFFLFGILFFVLFYVRFFCTNAAKLAKDQSKDEKMPFGAMVRNGLGIVLPFLILSVLLMIFVRGDYLDEFFIKAYDVFLVTLGKIIKFFIMIFKWLTRLLDKLQMKQVAEVTEEVAEGVPKEPDPWLRYATVILYIFSLAAIFFFVIKGIYSLIRMIPMKRKMQIETFEESDMVEIREKIQRKERKRGVRLPKIRRLYKKTVEKEMRAGYALEVSHTPRERAADILNKRGNNIGDLSQKYEKERYSC